jgi:hypothetical protein
MKKVLLFTITVCMFTWMGTAQTRLDSILPVRGLCIGAPGHEDVELFTKFISEDLKDMGVNTLVLMVDFGYAYESHPELRAENPLSKDDVKKLVEACKDAKIQIIPQINLLGHQSWHETVNPLLREYPEFDETPHVRMPEKFEWPNDDGLYCKSYCPLHPEVHDVVFALVDELMEVFEATAFHAGMDEVFYLGDDRCPRCAGIDKARLFADEVWRIRNHLIHGGHQLWIWGDRLIDGKATGMGMWEASMNHTARAIDMIPKDIVICDWHYERPDHTAPYFAMHQLDVVSCPYRKPEVGIAQLENLFRYRSQSTPDMAARFQGMMQTVWSPAGRFLRAWYGEEEDNVRRGGSVVESFRTLFETMNRLE